MRNIYAATNRQDIEHSDNMGDRAMEKVGGMQVSLSEVIESIEREMFERATKEENTEMVEVTNLEDDGDNERRYIKGRMECEDEA